MTPDAFFDLTDGLNRRLAGQERLFCSLSAETSDFARLNGNRIRQAGSVRSAVLGLTLIDGSRQAEASCDLTGDLDQDLSRAGTLLGRLRERLPHLPEDPYLNYSENPWTSDTRAGEPPPDPLESIGYLIARADGLDLVGIWASGEIAEGLASSLGHRHWHQSSSFNLDWSAFLSGDRAVKAAYAGLSWEPGTLDAKIDAMRQGLQVMGRTPRTLEPERYRAYLAPAAVGELMDMLAWGGFDLKSHRTRQTPLLKLVRGERAFDPRMSIREAHERGLTPRFTPEGFAKPETVTLIERGRYAHCLVDARDAKEYDETVNAAAGSPESVALDPGEIPMSEILTRLGTGLYVGNLWYCNWSDPNDCRITGMTRFGTYWVEDGEIVAPVNVMRFDDSLYHLLGERLEGLTVERELILSPQTYDGRSTDSALLPGILVSGIELAL
jgi:predicted Zn-dependent protease